MNPVKRLTLCLALASFTSAASANLLVNGSFEQPGDCFGAVSTLQGWSVDGGNLDIIGSACSNPLVPADGSYWLDMTGNFFPATISQSFATTPGNSYSLSFYFGGNPQWQYFPYPNDGPVKSMNALIDGSVVGTYTIDTTGLATSDAGWVFETVAFTANSSSTTVSFVSLNNSGVFGPTLDGVSVDPAAVPLPGTLGLLGVGFAALGIIRKRCSAHRLQAYSPDALQIETELLS